MQANKTQTGCINGEQKLNEEFSTTKYNFGGYIFIFVAQFCRG